MVLDSINCLHNGRSTRALCEKGFQRGFSAVGAGSKLMAKSDCSSQKSIQRHRKYLSRVYKEGAFSELLWQLVKLP